jgi:hypothetical protein
MDTLKALHHPRVRYLEHSVSGNLGSAHSGEDLFFTVIGDFDVDASTADKAGDLIEEALDTLSTDSVQYLTHGLVEGEQRDRVERGEGRPVRRRTERKKEPAVESSPKEEEVAEAAAEEVAEAAAEEVTKEASVPGSEALSPSASLEPTPQPLSSSIRTTLTVSIHTSELSHVADGATVPDEETLVAQAIEEVRQRYPEIPSHISPQSSFSRSSGEGGVITLTWEYEVPPATSEN